MMAKKLYYMLNIEQTKMKCINIYIYIIIIIPKKKQMSLTIYMYTKIYITQQNDTR